MAESFVFAKNKLSNGLQVYQEPQSRAVQYWGIEEPPPHKLKSVSVKIGNLTKIGIGMLFLLEEKISIGIGMLFASQNRYR